MKINKLFLNIYYKTIFFILCFIFIIGIFLYRSLFILFWNTSDTNKNDIINKEKIYVINKKNWCDKQKKYFQKDSLFYPIKFKCQKNKDASNSTIDRFGYVSVNKNAKATILLCHGFTTNKEDMSLFRYLLHDYNIVNFDFRAHGENIASQSCTLGCDEKYDVLGAINYIATDNNLNKSPLFVYGFSMGAVASILAESEHPNLFMGAIWDCPFESTNELRDLILEQLKISFNGYKIDMPFKNFIKKYIYNNQAQHFIKVFLKIFFGIDATKINTCIKKISPIKALKKITIPFLLIGCHNDDKAPAESIENMYYAHEEDSFVRCWISSGRRHFDALFINPEKYIYKINKFINSVLSKEYKNKIKKKITIDENSFLVNKKRIVAN
jgi:predicted alpha/beta-fold hydrolase